MIIDGITRYSYEDIRTELATEIKAGAKVRLKSIDARKADPERKSKCMETDIYVYHDWKVTEVYDFHFLVERNLGKRVIRRSVNMVEYWQKRSETIV